MVWFERKRALNRDARRGRERESDRKEREIERDKVSNGCALVFQSHSQPLFFHFRYFRYSSGLACVGACVFALCILFCLAPRPCI